MRIWIVTLAAITTAACSSAPAPPPQPSPAALASMPWPPLELEIRTPFEPTAFASAGRTWLTYELHITNFTSKPLMLRRIDVLDADVPGATPIAAIKGGELDTMLHRAGDPILGDRIPVAGSGYGREIASGGSDIVFLSVSLPAGGGVPARLSHRVYTADAFADAPAITTHRTVLRVLGPPVSGANWLASGGPGNDSHHRRGLLAWDGHTSISRRYAIDWLQVQGGASLSGDPLDNRSYYAYDEDVLAVGDARVVRVKDNIPENLPHRDPVAPLTRETASGNIVVLDLGGGQFAFYMHLKPGSIRVKQGDLVKRGQALARIGSSGDSREAHLHFEITTSPIELTGEGLPYLIGEYRVAMGGVWQARARELPLKDTLVDFGPYTGVRPAPSPPLAAAASSAPVPEDARKAAFEAADADRDGRIDKTQYRTVLEKLGFAAQLETLWTQRDANKDGFISLEEYRAPIPQ